MMAEVIKRIRRNLRDDAGINNQDAGISQVGEYLIGPGFLEETGYPFGRVQADQTNFCRVWYMVQSEGNRSRGITCRFFVMEAYQGTQVKIGEYITVNDNKRT